MANGGIAQVDLVGPSRGPVVTPQATQQLSEAFRSGFVTADEIVQRMSERTRAKQELELVTAKQGLEIAPLVQQARTAELKAAIFDAQAKPGGFNLMQEALSKAGFPVNIDPNAGLTDANKNEIVNRFSALQQYVTKRAEAEERVTKTETKFFPTEQKLPSGATTKGQLQKLFHAGQEITTDELKNWTQEAEALRRTPFSQWYALQAAKPGQVVAPVAPAPVVAAAPIVIEPAVAAQQRAQLMNQDVPNAASLTDQQVAALVQPRAVTPAPATVAPAAPQLGQVSPGLGLVTSIEAAPPVSAAADTLGNKLERELLDINNTDASIQQARQLAVPGIVGPGQIGVTRGMHQLLAALGRTESAQTYTSQDQLNTVIANEIADYVQKWKGAISDRELRFFQAARPRIDSTTERWQAYLNEWQSKNEKLRQVVSGQLPPDDAAAWAANPVNTGATAAAPTGTAPTVPTGATENTAVIGGRTYKVKIDSAGRKRYFIVQ